MTRVGDMLGYARVSTVEQDAGAQRERLEAAGAICVFEDVISGRKINRPGLTALLDQARPGDSICVVRLGRLGRSLKELLETVDELRSRQVNLISLEEKIDTTSAAGELVFHVFGAIAHFERRLISERIKDGLAAARKRGRKPGRPRIDKGTVDAALKLIDAGLSAGQVAKRLGVGRSTLYRIASARGGEREDRS